MAHSESVDARYIRGLVYVIYQCLLMMNDVYLSDSGDPLIMVAP